MMRASTAKPIIERNRPASASMCVVPFRIRQGTPMFITSPVRKSR